MELSVRIHVPFHRPVLLCPQCPLSLAHGAHAPPSPACISIVALVMGTDAWHRPSLLRAPEPASPTPPCAGLAPELYISRSGLSRCAGRAGPVLLSQPGAPEPSSSRGAQGTFPQHTVARCRREQASLVGCPKHTRRTSTNPGPSLSPVPHPRHRPLLALPSAGQRPKSRAWETEPGEKRRRPRVTQPSSLLRESRSPLNPQ